MAEPTRRSGLGRGLDSLIPSGPREGARGPLPPYEDPVVDRLDSLIEEVRRLAARVDDLARTTAASARRRSLPRLCVTGVVRLVTTARDGAAQLVGIGAGLALDVTDLALGTTRELLDVAMTMARGGDDPIL